MTEHFWLEGEPPDPSRLPSGCSFRTRCPFQDRACELEVPTWSIMLVTVGMPVCTLTKIWFTNLWEQMFFDQLFDPSLIPAISCNISVCCYPNIRVGFDVR